MSPSARALTPRSLTRSAVYLLFYQQDRLLMLRRYQTGFEDGNYSLVAGHLENQENATAAAMREAHEEVGVIIAPPDLEFVHVMHRKSEDDLVYFDFFFIVHAWAGEITNCEPDHCDDLRWFPVAHLPPNTIPYIRAVLSDIANGIKFSEYGWNV